MLHELLFALNGHHGMVFILQDEKFKVNDSLPFFHPAERGILNQLLDVATDVWKIDRFIQAFGASALSRTKSSDGIHGLYVEALCGGLDEVLRDYKNVLAQIEKVILQTGDARLSHLQHKIIPFQPVMHSLCGLINLIVARKAHGCIILDIVYRASCVGVGRVQEAVQRILHECHKVFYKQLLSWILQGRLHDPYEEFIVQMVHELDAPKIQQSESAKTKKYWGLTDSPGTNAKYNLRIDLLPCHISIGVAEKIFFIGESIQLFERERKLEYQGAVLKDKEVEFYNKLAELRESSEFRLSDFEAFIDGVRESVSRHLHHLVLESADLQSELGTLRNFFLLSRGEFFQTFIEEADPYLLSPPSHSTQHDVGQSFINACRRLLQDDDSFKHKVKISINIPQGKSPRLTGWDCIGLDYQVAWPLHLVVTPEVLDKYNSIFRFLLNVKRTQLKLQEIWAIQIKIKDRLNDELQLRTHMMFVVNNLQHYLMADVLESQFSVLIEKLKSSSNFEELRHAHEVFINSILAHTFINNKQVNQCLMELLSACQQYSQIVELDSENRPEMINSLSVNFSRQSSLLFKLLTSIRSRQIGSQLSQLLLRIDYNRYFSTHGHDIKTAS